MTKDDALVSVYWAELKVLVRLAGPLVFTQLAQMGMSVADTLMAGRVSATELGGVALGTVVFWPVIMLVSGVLMALTPSVSQLNGAGRSAEAGALVRQALWLALFGGILLMLVFRSLTPVYQLIGVDPVAVPVTAAYLGAVSWGVVPLLGYFTLRYLCEGLSWTLPAMLIAGSALLLKIPLNYWFIYGGCGLPALGGEGCGWASALVFVYQLVAITLVVAFSKARRAGTFADFSWPQWSPINRLLRLGLPIGLSTFFEFFVFSAMTLLIGRLGVEVLAAHQIASNIGALTFMIPLALGMAASIRVGHNVGRGDYGAARRSGWTAISLSLMVAVIAITVLINCNEWIAGLYTRETAVLATAAKLMLFVAMYQPADDLQVTTIGALRGMKDTTTPFIVAVCAYWLIGFPIAVVLGFGYFESIDYGVYGYWIGLIVGLSVAAITLLARFAYLSRREDRIAAFATR